MTTHVIETAPLAMLYDGDCGLCSATARWLERRVGSDRLRTLALDHATSDERLRGAVGARDLTASLHVVRPDGSVATGAAAVIAVGRLVPGWGIAARLMDHRAGRAILEPAYRVVARNRHRIGRALGLPSACAVPGGPAAPR